MAEEKLLNEFIQQMRTAAGENLLSVLLYGSAAEGEFHPQYSDLNLLCVLGDTSFASLAKISAAMEWWQSKKHHPPLVLTAQELKTSADVFSIEFVDMKQRYRVLHGEDVLRSLDVPLAMHRAQLRARKRIVGGDAAFAIFIHHIVSPRSAGDGRNWPQTFARSGRGTLEAGEL